MALTRELQRRRRDTKLGTKFHQTQATKHSQQRTRKQSQWLQEDVLSEILYVKLTFILSFQLQGTEVKHGEKNPSTHKLLFIQIAPRELFAFKIFWKKKHNAVNFSSVQGRLEHLVLQ